MNKLDREVQRALSKIGVSIVQRREHKGHTKLTIRLPTSEERTLTMAGSPKNTDHTIANVVRDARNFSNHCLKGTPT
jgi:hypothetical protein